MRVRSPLRNGLERAVAWVAGAFEQFTVTYLRLLLAPGAHLADAAAGSSWPFPLAVITAYCLLVPILLHVAWPTAAEALGISAMLGTRGMVVIFTCSAVFFLSLALAAIVCVHLFARQRASLLAALNCVAAGVVPLSALTVAAWIVFYLSPGLAIPVLVFGALAGFCFYGEALRSRYDLPTGCALYAIALTVAVALFASGLVLFTIFGRQAAS